MLQVAGVDAAPGGWAVVIKTTVGEATLQRITRLAELFESPYGFQIVAIDIPIGLLDAYEVGGRLCDRASRKLLGRQRGSSVFPAPVRAVLGASSWEHACALSRASSAVGASVSRQTYEIMPNIKQADELLQRRSDLRTVVREVHPEVCFYEMTGSCMFYKKRGRLDSKSGAEFLGRDFPEMPKLLKEGRALGLPAVDILDASAACWSALRLANGKGRSLPRDMPRILQGCPWLSGFEITALLFVVLKTGGVADDATELEALLIGSRVGQARMPLFALVAVTDAI